MKRSGIRGFVALIAPDSATLHPGYLLPVLLEQFTGILTSAYELIGQLLRL